jgi:SSS family solute:Na+ symporter/sodium/pantothenate symporter
MPMTKIGGDLLVWCGIYIALLLTIGWLGRRAKKEDSLSDHFLAGRGIGFLVLLFTLFATQYSGNSLSGFPGKTYRDGLSYFMSVTFMIGIVTGYTLFVPRLFRMAREKQYLTPNDYLNDRFGSSALHYLAVAVYTVALANFMLAQLMAMGHAFAGLTDGRIPYWFGVVGGAVVILIYELMGGMRAVAWTDALQGAILGLGLVLVVALLIFEVGTPPVIIEKVRQVAPAKVASPNWTVCFVWLSNFLLLGLGGPLYPQAIQRIYAARRMQQLRRALATMAFLPFIATTSVVFIGIAGIALFPNLGRIASDEITFKVLAHLVAQSPLAYYPALIVMMAVVAAIMSTADSCLLSLSSIFTKDVAARVKRLDVQESEGLTRQAPLFSVGIMTVLVLIALNPPTTLWALLVIKFEILIQLSPAFVLGTLHKRTDPRAFQARDIVTGLVTGLVIALTLYATGHKMVGGLHAGTIGVVANYLTVVLSRRVRMSLALRAA